MRVQRLFTAAARQWAYTGRHTLRRVIAVGLLLVLVGFVIMMPRGGLAGSTARRNVILGFRVFQTPGYQGGVVSWKYRLFRVLVGLAMMAGGMVLIATTT